MKSAPGAETKQFMLKEIGAKEVGAKWSKFSEPDLAGLKGKDDLVTQVVAKYNVTKYSVAKYSVAKYSLDKMQAQRDVDALMKGGSL
jgi:hypothetical protein